MKIKELLEIAQSNISSDIKEQIIKELFFRKQKGNNNCIDCEMPVSRAAKRCRSCNDLLKIKTTDPSRVEDITKEIESGATLQQLGDKYNVTRERIRQIYLKENGLGIKAVRDIANTVELVCEYCGKNFTGNKKRKILYCSEACRDEKGFYTHWELRKYKNCKKYYLTYRNRGRGRKVYCSKICQGQWFGKTYGRGGSKRTS